MTYKKNSIGLLFLLIIFVLFASALISLNSNALLQNESAIHLVVEGKSEKMVVTKLDASQEALVEASLDLVIVEKDGSVAKKPLLSKYKDIIIVELGYAWSD